MASHPVQVIAVTGGKGGVGKTNTSVNLSIALAATGQKVVLMDADLGLANVDIMLGISAKENLEHVLNGQCSLQDILVDGPGGIRIVPASSGVQSMVELGPLQHAGLINAFNDFSENIDTLVVDTAAGISDSVISFVRAAQEVIVVVCDEPTSITDAYAMIKLLNTQHHMSRFHILASMVRSDQEGRLLFTKLQNVCERFLDVALEFSGMIPFDEAVRKAVQRQKAVCAVYPSSKASLAYHRLAKGVSSWPIPQAPRGHLEFFVDRLVAGVAP